MSDLRTAATAVANAMAAINPNFICQAAHHYIGDRHTGLEPCPIEHRWNMAFMKIHAALAQEPAQPCLTCSGHGQVCHHAHDGSWDCINCPDCNPSQAAVQEPVAQAVDGVIMRSTVPFGYTGPLYAAPQPAVQEPPKRLSDEEVAKRCRCGPVYAPNGFVERTPQEYRRELESAMFRGFRFGEAAVLGEKP